MSQPPDHPRSARRRRRPAHDYAFGIVGLPEPGCGPRRDLAAFSAACTAFNRRFDELAATTRPEWRSTARECRQLAPR